MSDRHLEVTYCDDIRYEVGNKSSLIGIYGSELIADKFPLVLPKLCVRMFLVTGASDTLEKLIFRLIRDDKPNEPLVESEDFLANVPLPTPAPESTWRMYGSDFALVNFRINEPIRVRGLVETEGGIIKGRALKLTQTKGSESKA